MGVTNLNEQQLQFFIFLLIFCGSTIFRAPLTFFAIIPPNFLDTSCDTDCLRKLKETQAAIGWLKSEIERLCKEDPQTTIQQEAHLYQAGNSARAAAVPLPKDFPNDSPGADRRISDPEDVRLVHNDREIYDVIASTKAPCVSYFKTSLKGTWIEGREFCQARGLELATVRNRQENSVIYKNFGKVWLGGLRWNGKFLWNDQTNIDCFFFAVGEPNNKDHNENCIRMGAYESWVDGYCGAVHPIVCERRTCRPYCDVAANVG